MDKVTADNIIEKVSTLKHSMFLDEYKKITQFIYSLVEHKEESKTSRRNNNIPPLQHAWMMLWHTSFNTPLAIIIGVFLVGLLTGHYGWN